MRRFRFQRMFCLVLTLASVAAFADSTVTFSNTDGDWQSLNTRHQLEGFGSHLTGIAGLSGLGVADCGVFPDGGCSGMITTFITGVLATGSLTSNATFKKGGSLMTTGTGFTFSDQFVAGSSWTETVIGSGRNETEFWTYSAGIVDGRLTVDGHPYMIQPRANVELTTTHTGPISFPPGPLHRTDRGGTTTIPSPVPEPGSLALLGSGLVVLGFVLKHKLDRGSAETPKTVDQR